MLCDDCKEQPASVHLSQIVNGQQTELHLCFQCANRRNIQIWPIFAVAQPTVQPNLAIAPPGPHAHRQCPHCQLLWQEFLSTGFLGCTHCYSAFADLLSELIIKNHGNIRHLGKYPVKRGGPVRLRREIASLRSELEKAIHEENFEKAAELRDQIKALEQQVNQDA